MSRVAVTEAQSTKAWERGLREIASGLGCLLCGKPASSLALAVMWAFVLVRIASVDATSALRATILLAATVGHFARNARARAAAIPSSWNGKEDLVPMSQLLASERRRLKNAETQAAAAERGATEGDDRGWPKIDKLEKTE